MPATQSTAPGEDVAIAEDEKALELRLTGLTYRAMSSELDISFKTAERRVKRALNRRLAPKVDEYRAMEDERILFVIAKLIVIADNDDVKAADRIAAYNSILRASAQRAALHGLNAPVKVDATVVTVSQEDLEMQELIREAKMRASVVQGEVVA